MGTLDDPRGQEVDDLVFRAERLEKQGERAHAHELYHRAAVLETTLALETPRDAPRVRSLLAISAVSLWMRAGRHSRAEDVAQRFLADAAITPQGRTDLAALLETCRRAAMAEIATLIASWMASPHLGEPDFDADGIARLTTEAA